MGNDPVLKERQEIELYYELCGVDAEYLENLDDFQILNSFTYYAAEEAAAEFDIAEAAIDEYRRANQDCTGELESYAEAVATLICYEYSYAFATADGGVIVENS
jgi:hypothetical protein